MKLKPTLRLLMRLSAVALLLVLVVTAIRLSSPAAPASGSAALAAAAGADAARDVVAAPPAASEPLKLPVAAQAWGSAAVTMSTVDVVETNSGATVQQTFTLNAGWNSIYLGVDPINTSELVDPDKPELGHTLSLMQAVFAGVPGLEGVWTYNQPVTGKDYLIDPGQGMWDEPGWTRFIPDTNVDANGQSQAFLTTLHSLHANTAYLVKLKSGAPATTVVVSGKPAPGHHRWQADAYNLAGFPIGVGQAPTVQAFIAGSGDAITEMRGLNADGAWTAPMAGAQTLAPGVAYLVRYAAAPTLKDYTAPLDLRSETGSALPSEGLQFAGGMYANNARLMVKNLSAAGVDDITLSLLPDPAPDPTPKIALYFKASSGDIDLRQGPATMSLGTTDADMAAILEFVVKGQPAASEALLSISSATLGTRWLIPLSAAPATYAGLWVGEVVVDDVSQARLGATDETELTVPMVAMSSSEVRGTTDLEETSIQNVTTVLVTMTLSLPTVTPQTAVAPGLTAPYVQGRAYLDTNQNGRADRTEPGLVGVTVSFMPGSTSLTTEAVSAADGAFSLSNMQAGDHTITITGLPGYTTSFPIEMQPAALTDPPLPSLITTNGLPTALAVDNQGTIAVTGSSEYLKQILLPPSYTLPIYEEGQRVEPALNIGFVQEDEAGIYAGTCSAPRERLYPAPEQPAWQVINGVMGAQVTSTLADLIGNNIQVLRAGEVISCADIVIGTPTAFSDGRGSVAKFRIILRVDDSGNAELLPYYAMSDKERVSAVTFVSLQEPETASPPESFGAENTAMVFDWKLLGNDPLNPFKHKYNPDHDNLNRKFEPIQDSKLLEAYDVNRTITLTLRDLPEGMTGTPQDMEVARSMDWGGTVWGGEYREVLDGLHKNAITVRGYFTIRHMITGELREQDYDK